MNHEVVQRILDADGKMPAVRSAGLAKALIRDMEDRQTFGFFRFGDLKITLEKGKLIVSTRVNGEWVVKEESDYSLDTPIAAPTHFIQALDFEGKRALMRACGMASGAVAPARLTWKDRVGKAWKRL